MEIIRFNLTGDWNDLDDVIIQKAIDALKQGSAVVFPTDTVYGLGVDALNIKAVERLFRIKKRPAAKPVPIMVRDFAMAKKLVYLTRDKEKILNSVWPGPVTAVLEKRDIVPDILTGNKKTVGLRIPDHPFTKMLMEKSDSPITCTSANFSGEPPLNSSFKVVKTFERAYPRPNLILDAGDLPEGAPSTVLDLTRPQPKITRLGPISKKDLMKMIK